MIQFSDRNEKITKLFVIIFWIFVGFHIIFGGIAQLINFVIGWWLDVHLILGIADMPYALKIHKWIVS